MFSGHRPGLTLDNGHGPWNLGLLHGLGQMWVHESHPHAAESWCSYNCEFNGGL